MYMSIATSLSGYYTLLPQDNALPGHFLHQLLQHNVVYTVPYKLQRCEDLADHYYTRTLRSEVYLYSLAIALDVGLILLTETRCSVHTAQDYRKQ